MFTKNLLSHPFVAAVLILNLCFGFAVWMSEGAVAAARYLFMATVVLCLVFVAAYLVSLAIRIATSPKQYWDDLQRAEKRIKNGSYSHDDEDIKTGIVFDEKTGQYVSTARPADRLYQRILGGD